MPIFTAAESMGMRTGFAGLLAAFALTTATYAADVSALDDASLGGRNRYERCVELTRRNAQEALNVSIAWQGSGGAGAAKHCTALALIALKRYPEAAAKLDLLGHENVGSAAERAAVFGQAGNVWLLAHRGGEATASLSSALALSPRDPDLLADRARAAALLGDWKAAEFDLSTALKLDPDRADVLVLRASARHAMGRKADARSDLEAALRIVPNYPEALVERGTLKLESGDAKGARADWQAAAIRAPGSAAGVTAQQRLNALPLEKKR